MLAIKEKAVNAGALVNTQHVDTVIKNYKQERWVHNSKRLEKEDSLSVWFTLEEIQQFLALAKENGGDGVRLYFGAYDKGYETQPMYAGRQTVVLVATKEKDSVHGTVNKDIYINTENGPSILAYNMGKLCPPACLGSDDGFGIGVTILDKGDDGLAIG
jgi:hypothetical protein